MIAVGLLIPRERKFQPQPRNCLNPHCLGVDDIRNPTTISLKILASVFTVLLIGFTIPFLVLIGEIFVNHLSSSKISAGIIITVASYDQESQ